MDLDMTTQTLEPKQSELWSFTQGMLNFANEPKISYHERDGHKVMKISDIAVFRTGTFRDSMGDQRTWDEFQMESFVRNYNHMRDSGILPQVPVRRGHPTFGQNPIDTLIGYVVNLRTETKKASIEKMEYCFLVADFEILDEDAQKKIASKLWVNRSSEVGIYFDNNDTPYEAFMGVAYVDLPAVERLNEFSRPDNLNILTEEVMAPQPNSAVVTPPPVPAAPAQFSLNGTTESDPAKVQSYIQGLEGQNAAYRAAAEKQRLTDRESYVDGLLAKNVYTSAQAIANKAVVATLDDSQYIAWRASQELLQPLTILENHGNAAGNDSRPANAPTGAPGEPPTAEELAFQTSKGVCESLSMAGIPVSSIEATADYKRVMAKDPTFTLPGPVTNLGSK